MKEVKITPPEGYEIDKENSTFECIKFKPIVKIWRNIKNTISGYSIDICGTIRKSEVENLTVDYIALFNSEKEAKSAIAMAKISQIMANDERFGGIITNEEWNNNILKYTITRQENVIITSAYYSNYSFLAFHTKEQRDLFLKENKDLILDYLML